MNSQTLGEIFLSPLAGSALVAHVPAEAREQLATRFAVYTSPWHQAQILECRDGQGTQLSHLVAPVLWTAPWVTAPAIPMCPPVPSRQPIVCQASSRLLDVVRQCIGMRGSIAFKAGLPRVVATHMVALARRDRACAAGRGGPRQRQASSPRVTPRLLHGNSNVLRPHVSQCSDLREIAMPDICPNGLRWRERSFRRSRWRGRQPVRDVRLPCQRKLTEGIGEPSREGNRLKVVTLCAPAHIAAGYGAVLPKRLGQRREPLSLVSPGFEPRDCWYETGSEEGGSPLQGLGMTDSGVSAAGDHGRPSLRIKRRDRLEGAGHTDAAIESLSGAESPKTLCNRA
jgi:hypothetical protein